MAGGHKANTRKAKILAASKSKWDAVGRAYGREIDPRTGKPRGEDAGRLLAQALSYSEIDYSYGCKFLFGVTPFEWQRTYNDGIDRNRLNIARLMNGGGKTTDFALRYMYRGFFRKNASPTWGQYRMFHFTPQESQGMETKLKMDEILASRAREQAYVDSNGMTQFRRCFAARWIQPKTFGQHEGFSFFNGSATVEFAPTAFMGMGKDGTDPMLIGLDEARHERNLTHLVQKIWIPRFLRTPGSRLVISYTPMDASPELEMLLEHAQESRNWFAFIPLGNIRKVNPSLQEADVRLVEEELDKTTLKMVTEGKAIQPKGAKFNIGSVKAMFTTTKDDEQFHDLRGLRARVEGRCSRCRRKLDGHPEAHMMVGEMDPASSAVDGDSIVYMAWDIDAEPPLKPISIEYVYEIERTGEKDGPETIQNVAKHFKALAREIRGPVGYDAKSALGHNVADHIVELEDEGVDVREVRWNSEEAKDAALDKVGALIDGGFIESRYHRKLRIQLISYIRRDRHIAQDFVMTMAVGAEVAWDYLPDFITDPKEQKAYEHATERSSVYDAGAAFGWEGFEAYGPAEYGGPDPAFMDSMPRATVIHVEDEDRVIARGSGVQRGFARG